MSQIQIHPELTRVREHVAARREQLASLIEEETRLRERQVPFLLAEYDVRLGTLECERLRLQAGNAAKRRTLELLVARLNQGQELTPEVRATIEKVVRVELADWAARLAQREHEVRRHLAEYTNSSSLTADEARQCKSVYRKLCRTLHPDVTGVPSEAHARYWNEVQAAYAAGDVQRLEAIAEVVGASQESATKGPDSLEIANTELARLGLVLERQLERIRLLRAEPPLCWAQQLEDTAWVAGKQNELRESIQAERAIEVRLDHELFLLGAPPHEVH